MINDINKRKYIYHVYVENNNKIVYEKFSIVYHNYNYIYYKVVRKSKLDYRNITSLYDGVLDKFDNSLKQSYYGNLLYDKWYWGFTLDEMDKFIYNINKLYIEQIKQKNIKEINEKEEKLKRLIMEKNLLEKEIKQLKDNDKNE